MFSRGASLANDIHFERKSRGWIPGTELERETQSGRENPGTVRGISPHRSIPRLPGSGNAKRGSIPRAFTKKVKRAREKNGGEMEDERSKRWRKIRKTERAQRYGKKKDKGMIRRAKRKRNKQTKDQKREKRKKEKEATDPTVENGG